MKVLGVDLGLRTCGYVLCNVENLNVTLIKEGEIIPIVHQPLPQKLSFIFEELAKEITAYKPVAIIVEKLYSHYRHPTTLGILAQVRGIIGLLAYHKKIGFFEYSPTRARKSFLGRGNVDSNQVRKMAENITGRKIKSNHTADAFSLVVAFSHEQKFKKVLHCASAYARCAGHAPRRNTYFLPR